MINRIELLGHFNLALRFCRLCCRDTLDFNLFLLDCLFLSLLFGEHLHCFVLLFKLN